MNTAFRRVTIAATSAFLLLAAATAVRAQPATTDASPWSIDFGVGWDNDISGNVNSSGIGAINGQTVVILKRTYEEVYGTGLHLRGGAGYQKPGTNTEFRASLTFQSLDADYVTPLGDIGVSKLYAQYTDYQALTLDFGVREYYPMNDTVRYYGEGYVGIGFVDKIDATLVAPSANLTTQANDFYDQSTAFSVGVNFGVMGRMNNHVSAFGQLGLRYMTGLAEVDDLVGTGLDTINDKSSRWTLPFVVGVRYGF